MILSLLLRSTLLLLVVNHSIAQEWYTQDNYGPEFYSPSMVKDTPPSFLEKREAEILANESKLVYLPDYASNIRQKRDLNDADNEQQSSDVTEYTPNDISGPVDELSDSNVQSVDLNTSPDTNDQRVANNSYEYANSDTSNSYEYPQSDDNSGVNSDINSDVNSDTNSDVNSEANSEVNSEANSDVNSDESIVTGSVTNSDVNSEVNSDANIVTDSEVNSDANIDTNNVTNSDVNSNVNNVTNSETNFYGNETTDQRLEDRANDFMEEKDEPANYADTSDTKAAGNNEVIQEGSGESSFQADDSHTINKEENDSKPEGEHAVEADQSNQRKIVGKEQENKTRTATSSSTTTTTTTTTTTSPNESGSGSIRRDEEEEDDDDDDDDDERVKGDEDEDEDEQPVKRQNLGTKLM